MEVPEGVDVEEVFARYADGEPTREIANDIGVTRPGVYNLLHENIDRVRLRQARRDRRVHRQ